MFQSVALSQTPPSKRRVPVEGVSSDGAIAVADPPPKGALKKRTVCVEMLCCCVDASSILAVLS